MNPLVKNNTLFLWQCMLCGALFWWIIGLNLFIYHIAAFVLWFYLLGSNQRGSAGLFLPPSAILLFMIAAVYLFSIVIHIPAGDMNRVIAALYNFSFWLMGGALVIVLANVYEVRSSQRILKPFLWLALTLGALAVIVLFAWKSGHQSLVFKTPLYGLTRVMGKTTLVESSLLVRPLLWDWFASFTRPRFNAFSPYPTAAGGIIMIVLMMLITRGLILKKTFSMRFWLLIALNAAALVITLSRMSVFAFGASLMMVYVLQKRNFAVWLAFLMMFFLAAEPLIQHLFEFFLGLREGSNSVRMDLYRYSIAQLEGADWVIGQGLKPRESHFIYPIGSHSTYVSLLFKSGLSGVGLFALFQALLITRWFLLKRYTYQKRQVFFMWRGLGLVFISMGMWMATEDIDAPQLLAFIYFSLVGVFEGLRKELLHGNLSEGSAEEARLPAARALSS